MTPEYIGIADYIVLGVYFLVLVAIGLYCARLNKRQEDYFMGGRGFGKLMQTFAAFGAGTIPNNLANIISEKAKKGCLFIISSRVSKVSVMAETMTSIDNNNGIPAGTLNPQKSAILLSLGLKENLKAFELVKFLKLLEIQ